VIDSRWQYLRKYQGIRRRETAPLNEDLREMKFAAPADALDWFVREFESVDARKIYGCGPCCNDFIFSFIGRLESGCGKDLNEVVASRFDLMTVGEKHSVIASYEWFFGYCGGDEGREKLRRLEESLSQTEFFREIRAANEAAKERARLAGLKEAHLGKFSAEESEISREIGSHRQEIQRIQSEIEILNRKLQSVRRSKERESELYEFDRLSVSSQIAALMGSGKPIAYYEGRLAKILEECGFRQISRQTREKLLADSKSAKPGKLPQVAKLHKIMRGVGSR